MTATGGTIPIKTGGSGDKFPPTGKSEGLEDISSVMRFDLNLRNALVDLG